MPFIRRAVVQVGDQRFEDLRVVFDVTRSLSRSENTAEVVIYNLTKQNRETLVAADRVPVVILAGYVDTGVEQVFSGLLERVTVEREGADVATRMSSGDGPPAKIPLRAHAPDADLGAVFGQLVTDLGAGGIGAGNSRAVQRALRGRSLGSGGTTTSEDPREALDQLLIPAGFEASIQAGAIQVAEIGAVVAGTAPVISPATGLEGRASKKERRRVAFKAKIIPGIAPGRRVVLQSEDVSGTFRVESARWVGDTRGGGWSVEVEASPPRT